MSTSLNSPDYTVPEVELQRILDRISSSPPAPVAIIGLPGAGKSSLLRFLTSTPMTALARFLKEPYRSHPERLIVVPVTFRTMGHRPHPFSQMLEAMTDRLRLAGLDLPPSSAAIGGYSAAQAASAIQDVLKSCDSIAVRPVLLLDDFDLIFKDLDRLDAARLRPQPAAAMVMAVEHSLEEVNPVASDSPFFQLVLYVHMRGLSPSEAIKLVLSTSGAPLPDVESLSRLVMPFPLVLEKAAQILAGERRLRGVSGSTPLNRELSQLLIDRLKEGLHGVFEFYWGRVDPRQRDVLLSLAEGLEPQSGGLAYPFLENRGLISYSARDRHYQVSGDLFADFMRTQKRGPEGLSAFEAELYEFLRARPSDTCTIGDLLAGVWKTDDTSVAAARRVQVAVSRLREKLAAADQGTIVNVRGRGYRLQLR